VSYAKVDLGESVAGVSLFWISSAAVWRADGGHANVAGSESGR
jgi:hypothetical protein